MGKGLAGKICPLAMTDVSRQPRSPPEMRVIHRTWQFFILISSFFFFFFPPDDVMIPGIPLYISFRILTGDTIFFLNPLSQSFFLPFFVPLYSLCVFDCVMSEASLLLHANNCQNNNE